MQIKTNYNHFRQKVRIDYMENRAEEKYMMKWLCVIEEKKNEG